jgi:uncharacterized protein
MTTVANAKRAAPVEGAPTPGLRDLLPYLIAGVGFGIVLVKSEVVSWFRIQEMFRFQSFHMYGIIGSGFLTALVSLRLLRALHIRTLRGEPIQIAPKQMERGIRYAAGGFIFGLGWAITGTCPGPLFALIGAGFPILVVVLGAALLGTWAYGYLRPRLPH